MVIGFGIFKIGDDLNKRNRKRDERENKEHLEIRNGVMSWEASNICLTELT